MKIYYNRKTNELWHNAQLIADLTEAIEDDQHIDTILCCFDEDKYPASILDPVPPPPLNQLTPAVRVRVHSLNVNRLLTRINRMIESHCHPLPAPIKFCYSETNETVSVKEVGARVAEG